MIGGLGLQILDQPVEGVACHNPSTVSPPIDIPKDPFACQLTQGWIGQWTQMRVGNVSKAKHERAYKSVFVSVFGSSLFFDQGPVGFYARPEAIFRATGDKG